MIDRLDHLVLTVRSLIATCQFYRKVLGMDIIDFAGDRKALRFGQSKINLHEVGREIEPKAERPTPGSADLCFVTSTPGPRNEAATEAISAVNKRPNRQSKDERQLSIYPSNGIYGRQSRLESR